MIYNNIYAAKTSDVSPNYTEWPSGIKKIKYLSSADNMLQTAMFYNPSRKSSPPLLVALHTWSGDYNQSGFGSPYAQWCIENSWAFIHPDFRGPNKRPEATGSEFTIKDIISSIEYAKGQTNIDISRIYLIGLSGGGHASLLMAGRHPEIWAAVSAWVPISDLKAWYYECKENKCDYYKQIADSCGGEPMDGSASEVECKKRSPISYLDAAKNVYIDINAGIHDGHTGSVYISHSLNAYNLLAEQNGQISQKQIRYFVENEKVPAELACKVPDVLYGEKNVLFRKESGNVRITIFDGGHEIIYLPALNWLATKVKP
jgi:hypothetical protein